MIEVRPVQTKRERNIFMTFPWRIYKHDPLWIPRSYPSARRPWTPPEVYFSKAAASPICILLERRQAGWNDLLLAGKRRGAKTCSASSNALTITL